MLVLRPLLLTLPSAATAWQTAPRALGFEQGPSCNLMTRSRPTAHLQQSRFRGSLNGFVLIFSDRALKRLFSVPRALAEAAERSGRSVASGRAVVPLQRADELWNRGQHTVPEALELLPLVAQRHPKRRRHILARALVRFNSLNGLALAELHVDRDMRVFPEEVRKGSNAFVTEATAMRQVQANGTQLLGEPLGEGHEVLVGDGRALQP
mmetsp:Transcript_33412/g.92306  ORF Transcript_33412/g.92306 Transcript_33412/m.92306 type:complete len:209 (+) Transcript_33412:3-629(+)